ncbi:MAG: glycogen debranching protein [Roseburia sp.]|nr:glycogen debranching protein [Roseburia sp.]
MRAINLRQMPFTRKNSYIALSELGENYQNNRNDAGLYLRTIHNSTITPLIAKITLQTKGKDTAFASYLEHAALVFSNQDARIDCCFADADTLLIRGSEGTGIQLDFLTENGPYDYIYEIAHEGRLLYMANCYKNNNRYLVWLQEGSCSLEQQWEESSSLYSRLQIQNQKQQGFFCIIKEIETEWNRTIEAYDYEAARQKTEADFLDFYSKMPELNPRYEEMGYMAAFLNWSSIVRPDGFLKREAMYMSKNWMTNVWSWDHCFNALALSYQNPELAWDTFMIMADFQDASGRLPDSVSDNHIIWNYTKPPIHGWALGKMLEHMELSAEQTKEAFLFLKSWTKWWMDYRRIDGLYYYNHGNDSGWDNSTVFSELPPIAAPELQADMIIQMQVLAKLAEQLGETEEKNMWDREAQKHQELFLEKCFRNHLPVAIQCHTGKIIENQSLLPYEVLILGKELPEEIQNAIITVIKSDKFFTDYGFATESPSSRFYREDGYWRGPIWAPSTMMLIDGLDKCGEKELAREAAEKFADMVSSNGFAENFNALTGEGLRDLAYTWTASVAVVLEKEYLS